MQRLATAFAVGAAVAVLAGLPTIDVASAAGETNLVVSNFRYCRQAPCEVGDSAYLRSPSGPISGTDNTAAFIDVVPGDVVTWAYHDQLCDVTQCPGHEVQFEKEGPVQGSIGFMEAGPHGQSKISWTVPAELKAGTVLRYFCDVQTHWKEGLTGAFRIVEGQEAP